MYNQYGSSRHLSGQSGTYQHILHTKFGTYAFNAIDMTPNPGPNRPFNFFGIVEKVGNFFDNEWAVDYYCITMIIFGNKNCAKMLVREVL